MKKKCESKINIKVITKKKWLIKENKDMISETYFRRKHSWWNFCPARDFLLQLPTVNHISDKKKKN